MLIANGVRLSSQNPMHQSGAANFGSQNNPNWLTSGKRRCSFGHFNSVLGGYHSGLRHPASWCMAPDGGALTAEFQTDIVTANAGAGAMGVNGVGSTTITFTNADAQLQLVVSASGSATITVTPTGNLAGALYAQGATALTVTNAAATLGALAGLFGNATMAVTPSATIRAVGWIEGDITPFTELSPQSLSNAVWSAAATSNNLAGSMGEKLNDAGSASNPWTEVIESGLTAAEVLRIIAAALAGDATGLENGSPVFKSLDGSKDRITATYATGTRSVSALDGT